MPPAHILHLEQRSPCPRKQAGDIVRMKEQSTAQPNGFQLALPHSSSDSVRRDAQRLGDREQGKQLRNIVRHHSPRFPRLELSSSNFNNEDSRIMALPPTLVLSKIPRLSHA